MSKKALLALCLAILLPLVSYLIVKKFGEASVRMPPRYYYDSVVNKVVDGKQVTDTIWHQVADISLTNQLGNPVKLSDLNGRIVIMDFFFTRCPNICPRMTKSMKGLQDALKLRDPRKRVDTSFVQFVSFTVDPKHDSATVLKKFADRYGVNHDVWWMVTGPKDSIYRFAVHELKLGLQDTEVTEDFVHSSKFVLLDRNRIVRGYYDGLDSMAMSRLAEDLTVLMLEKDKKKKRKIF